MSAQVVASFTGTYSDEEIEVVESDANGDLPPFRQVKFTTADGGTHVVVLSDDDAFVLAVTLLNREPLREVYRLGWANGCEESSSVDHHKGQVHPGEDDAVDVALHKAKGPR